MFVVVDDDEGEAAANDFSILPDETDSERAMGELSSWSPSNFSNSIGSLAIGKSCLFANINRGVPWLSGLFAVRMSSIFASSIRSKSHESTTNMIPSVHLV